MKAEFRERIFVNGAKAVILAGALIITLLARPQWREYVGEGVLLLSALSIGRFLTRLRNRSFPNPSSSDFALARLGHYQMPKTPPQLSKAISLTARPGVFTIEFLASEAERRLLARFGCGIESDDGKLALGGEVYKLLSEKKFAPSLSATSARYEPPPSLEQVRTILDRLEQL